MTGTAGPGRLAGGDPEAGADALIGLAADALGVGRLAASAALLARAAGLADRAAAAPAGDPAGVGRAELAMAAVTALRGAATPGAGSNWPSAALPGLRRHRVKSDVVLAAALCCAGDLTASRAVADAALADTEAYGLVPLRWALACLLADIGSDAHSPGGHRGDPGPKCLVRDRHGGRWKTR